MSLHKSCIVSREPEQRYISTIYTSIYIYCISRIYGIVGQVSSCARFNKNQSTKFIELAGQLFNTQYPVPQYPIHQYPLPHIPYPQPVGPVDPRQPSQRVGVAKCLASAKKQKVNAAGGKRVLSHTPASLPHPLTHPHPQQQHQPHPLPNALS